MPVSDRIMLTAIDLDKLKLLFQSHRSGNETEFFQAAEAIILSQLAANHHSSATDLKKALGAQVPRNTSSSLSVLPKDRRNGDELIFIDESAFRPEMLVYSEETSRSICRVLTEHRNRAKLAHYGYYPKAKLLFWGPPGCGKTVTARYIASELGLPLGVLRLSSVISSFVGDTAAHLQRVFVRASSTPMVLLIDEVDAIGKNRDDRNDVGELKRVVNSLLQSMDTFGSRGPSLLIAASNHQYLLDSAVWRRFDDVVEFRMPEPSERQKFLEQLLNGVRFKGRISELVRATRAMSFADIERVAVEAVKSMILEGRELLLSSDLLEEARRYKGSVWKAQMRNTVRRK
jgi:AAA+ superfamily predicted ATPase